MQETNRFSRQPPDAGTECQAVTLSALPNKNVTRLVFVLQELSGIAFPVVTGNHPSIEGR